jgi:hypothetical protein
MLLRPPRLASASVRHRSSTSYAGYQPLKSSKVYSSYSQLENAGRAGSVTFRSRGYHAQAEQRSTENSQGGGKVGEAEKSSSGELFEFLPVETGELQSLPNLTCIITLPCSMRCSTTLLYSAPPIPNPSIPSSSHPDPLPVREEPGSDHPR